MFHKLKRRRESRDFMIQQCLTPEVYRCTWVLYPGSAQADSARYIENALIYGRMIPKLMERPSELTM